MKKTIKVKDITERTESEKQVNDNFALFRGLFESAPEAVFIGDCDTGKFLDCNAKAVALFGYTHEELLEKNPGMLSPEFQPDGTNSVEGSGQMVMRAMGGEKVIFEWIHLNGHGQEIDCEVRLTRLNIVGRNLVRGSVIDISEKKLAEIKLQRANRLYAFISNINQSIVHFNEEKYLFDKACDIAVAIGNFKMAWIGLINEQNGALKMVSQRGTHEVIRDLKPYVETDFSTDLLSNSTTGRALRTGHYAVSNDAQNDPGMSFWHEYQIQNNIRATISFPLKKFGKTAGIFAFHSETLNFFDEQEIRLLKGAAEDISFALELFEKEKLRREVEEKLRRNETQLNEAQAVAKMGSWELDMINNMVVWSDQQFHLLGFQPGEVKPSNELFFGMVHPDDAAKVNTDFGKTMQNAVNSSARFRLIRKDGTVINLLCEWKFEFDDNKKPKRIHGILEDLTEKIKQEEQRELFVSIVNSSDDAIISKTLEGIVTSWNPGAEKILGYSSAEIVGQNISLIAPAFNGEDKMILDKICLGESVDHYETQRVKKDGEIIDVSLTVSPIRDAMGNIVGASKILRNVTERKRDAELLEAKRLEMETLLNNTEESFILLDTDLNMVSFNKMANERAQALIHAPLYKGMSIFQLAAPKNIPQLKDMYKRVLKGEGTETELRSKLGGTEELVFTNKIKPVYNDKGAVDGVFIIASDVTERKKAENEIRELNEKQKAANQQLSTILDTLPANIALLDKNGVIIAVDEAWKKFAIDNDMEGRHYAVGDNYLDVCEKATGADSDGAETMAIGIKQVLQGVLDGFALEYPCHSPVEARWFRVEVRPLEEKKNSGAVVMHINITEQKLAENEIKSLNENLENRVQERTAELSEANKALETFSYSVSHDLRAPVRSIMGFAKILQEYHADSMDDESKELFKFIDDNGKRANAIIDDLLMLAKYDRVTVVAESVDMKLLVESIWSNISLTNPHHAMLRLSELPIIYADKSMIEQVVINLLSNAIKYSSKKEGPQVSIWSEYSNGMYTFYVKDNGAGFDMAHYGKLFGAFQRLHGMSEYEGTGVGLTLVKRIIEKHGGTVGADARVDEGATFYFTLPADGKG